MALSKPIPLPPVRLVACDLDGTLIGPKGEGLETAKLVADYCRSRRVLFTIATGRVLGSVRDHVRHLSLAVPFVSNGGAVIASPAFESLWERTICPAQAGRIAFELRKKSLPFYFITPHSMATEWEGKETEGYSKAISYPIDLVSDLTVSGLAPTQIVVRAAPDDAAGLASDFRSKWSPGITVLLSLPHLIEIQSQGVSKASALERLARRFGVKREEVLAVGDGLNDLDMLAWAGRSGCVANAHPEVIERSGIIAGRSHAEGVFEVVKRSIQDR